MASAEPEDLTAYRGRVSEACGLLAAARAGPAALRADPTARARALLARGGEVRWAGRVLRADDPLIAASLTGLDDDALDRAIAACGRSIAQLDAVVSPRVPDGEAIDLSLASVRRAYAEAGVGGSLGAALLDRIAEWLRAVQLPVPDLSLLALVRLLEVPFLIAAAAVVAAFVTILGRGIRERIRREVLLPGAAAGAAQAGGPREQLRLADRAAAAGDGREAIHALYQYAIVALTAREAIRFDPALTDRELLGRAAGVPHVESLRALVALHEQVWFGLRSPQGDEPGHARAWALEVGG